jgi:hypothetical protein
MIGACIAIVALSFLSVRAAAIGSALLIADHTLLRLEAKGVLNYRRKGLSRGAAGYHALELGTIYTPGLTEVSEVRYATEEETDDSGEPLH